MLCLKREKGRVEGRKGMRGREEEGKEERKEGRNRKVKQNLGTERRGAYTCIKMS